MQRRDVAKRKDLAGAERNRERAEKHGARGQEGRGER
jgi:hypothetical protein